MAGHPSIKIFAIILLAAMCMGQATQPAAKPAPESQPATASAPAIDPAAMTILRQLETAGDKNTTIRANVTLTATDRLTGDSEQRTGWLVYRRADANTPSGFRVHYDTRRLGKGRPIKDKEDWAFDGRMLTVIKHRIKDVIRYQIVAEGEKADPMRLGKGPFLVPFGQKVDDVLKFYVPTTRELRKGEPAGTKYLELRVRRDRYKDVDLTRVEMWIDAKTHLPVKLTTRDKKKKITTVEMKDVKTNVAVDFRKMFHIPRPAGYTHKVERPK